MSRRDIYLDHRIDMWCNEIRIHPGATILTSRDRVHRINSGANPSYREITLRIGVRGLVCRLVLAEIVRGNEHHLRIGCRYIISRDDLAVEGSSPSVNFDD